MKRILIADSNKASLVMTSEVFKDHYPGIQVLVARNSAEAVNLAKSAENIDAFVVDFDLPDANGAQTALLLKKISKTPILITAFDNNESVQLIETLLMKYDDCKSWLKKPINPEVVIAVAQRYCEGKIRIQKRIPCHLQAFAQIQINMLEQKIKVTKSTASKAKTTKTKVSDAPKKTLKAAKTSELSLCFYGFIEDCSLSGIKLKPTKLTADGADEWKQLLANMAHIPEGSLITVKVPSFLDIEHGNTLELTKIKTDKTIKSGTKKTTEENTQELKGKIAWVKADSGEWRMGVEFMDQALSKRFFESIVSFQSRQHKATQKQSIMKTTRSA